MSLTVNSKRFNLELLIHGFVNASCSESSCNLLYIPSDMINLIIIYYTFHGLDSHTFLVSIETNSSQYEIMKLFNISNQRMYPQRIIFADPNFNNFKSKKLDKKDVIEQWSRKNPGQCIINHVPLPFHLQKNKYLYDKYDDYQSNLKSSNWSLIIHVGGYNNYKQSPECHLTAFNRASLHDDMNRYSHAYNFEAPPFPEPTSNPSIVYNANNQTLYAMNGLTANSVRGHGRTIYSLSLSDEQQTMKGNHLNNDDTWQWNIQSTKLKRMRFNTSCCMVDHGRFIAILGGYRDSKKINYGELYALNLDKSIWFKCMTKARQNACSLYHDTYHKIIIGGEDIKDGLESYDINKDDWRMLKTYNTTVSPYNRLQNLWVSENNPSILFLVGVDLEYNVYLESIDMRQKQQRENILIHSKSLFYGSITKARKKHFGLLYSSFYPNNSNNHYYGLAAIHL
eukprot:505248_1